MLERFKDDQHNDAAAGVDRLLMRLFVLNVPPMSVLKVPVRPVDATQASKRTPRNDRKVPLAFMRRMYVRFWARHSTNSRPNLCEPELSSRQVVPYLKSLSPRRLLMELILIVVVLVLLFGGGGYWGRRRGHW